MRANIFRHEFNARLRSVLTWAFAAVVVILLYSSVFSSFAQDAELLNEMMTKFPKELLIYIPEDIPSKH